MRRLSRGKLRHQLESLLSSNRYQAVIFDLNGVFGGYSRALFILKILRSKGIVFAIWCVFRFLVLKEEYNNLLCGECCEQRYWEKFLKGWPGIIKKINPEDMKELLSSSVLPIDQDMVGLLKDLRQKDGLRLFVLSDINRERIEELENDSEYGLLLREFDEVFYSCNIKFTKLCQESFEYVLEAVGLTSDEVIFIDDNPRNVANSLRFSVQAILLKSSTV